MANAVPINPLAGNAGERLVAPLNSDGGFTINGVVRNVKTFTYFSKKKGKLVTWTPNSGKQLKKHHIKIIRDILIQSLSAAIEVENTRRQREHKGNADAPAPEDFWSNWKTLNITTSTEPQKSKIKFTYDSNLGEKEYKFSYFARPLMSLSRDVDFSAHLSLPATPRGASNPQNPDSSRGWSMSSGPTSRRTSRSAASALATPRQKPARAKPRRPRSKTPPRRDSGKGLGLDPALQKKPNPLLEQFELFDTTDSRASSAAAVPIAHASEESKRGHAAGAAAPQPRSREAPVA